jgi:hypothetical protein
MPPPGPVDNPPPGPVESPPPGPVDNPPPGPVESPPPGPVESPPPGPVDMPPLGPVDIPPPGPVDAPPPGPVDIPRPGPVESPPFGPALWFLGQPLLIVGLRRSAEPSFGWSAATVGPDLKDAPPAEPGRLAPAALSPCSMVDASGWAAWVGRVRWVAECRWHGPGAAAGRQTARNHG